jgi:SAM-dependent methyltransferase
MPGRKPSDYERTFEARGGSYNAATALCPEARATERRLLLDLLACEPGEVVSDAPAGGGYLAAGMARAVGATGQVVCVEPSPVFAAGTPAGIACVRALPEALGLAAGAVDRVGSLAAMHHLDAKQPYVAEVFRVLRPGGRFGLAEARTNSPVARFLNGSVHRLTDTGHVGRFVAAGEITARLTAAGFGAVSEREHAYTWDFPDHATMVRYCHDLFGLVSAAPDEVARVLADDLGIVEDAAGAHLRWSLVYAVGTKPA